ncbi:hypothetical protein L596_029344 [Steinernema carpocapsae]|uniref:Uncharacterized protein n=1 Tax=Steinernema carpocapsae TaxID=34508 RepID=A0A4U5LUC9_STECR|nr:hypothetical protein L596_029344 [Steinernema carpocapsae]
MEMDLTTHPRELYPIEPLPETHLQFCAHGKLSLKSVIAGDVKLVNRTAAITLLQKFNLGLKMSRKCFAQAESQEDCFEYYSDLESSDPVELCSGLDICIDCVKHFKHEGSFKDRLEKTCQLAQSICKNKFRSHDYQRVPCPPEYIPVPGAVWVAKNQLSSFKKLALKQMEYLKRLSGEENLQLNFTTNAAPYKVAPVKVEEEKTQEEKKPRDATPVTPVLSPKETLKVERGKLKKLSPVIDKAIRKSGEPAEDEFDITDGEASDTSGSDPEEKKRKFKAETEGTPNPFAGLVAFKNGAGQPHCGEEEREQRKCSQR